MRLGISYRMHFRYSEAVTESQNEVRVRPRDDDFQRVLSYQLTSGPVLEVLSVFDYWGTVVEHLGVRKPHTELELAEADVETAQRLMPSVAPERAALAEEDFRSTHLEYLVPSQHVGWDSGDVVEQRAASAVAGTSSVVEMVLAVIADVRAALLYRQDSTDIGVTLPELLVGGAGVCQDFAHLALGMLRSVGVPARYVSGYLFAADETEFDAQEADLVSVQTHAWVEVAVPGWGWWALDPTNGGEAGERHVVIGCGRDYGDVPPVRGVFSGPGVAAVDAEVVISKQADGPAGQLVSESSGPLTVPIAAQAKNQHNRAPNSSNDPLAPSCRRNRPHWGAAIAGVSEVEAALCSCGTTPPPASWVGTLKRFRCADSATDR